MMCSVAVRLLTGHSLSLIRINGTIIIKHENPYDYLYVCVCCVGAKCLKHQIHGVQFVSLIEPKVIKICTNTDEDLFLYFFVAFTQIRSFLNVSFSAWPHLCLIHSLFCALSLICDLFESEWKMQNFVVHVSLLSASLITNPAHTLNSNSSKYIIIIIWFLCLLYIMCWFCWWLQWLQPLSQCD